MTQELNTHKDKRSQKMFRTSSSINRLNTEIVGRREKWEFIQEHCEPLAQWLLEAKGIIGIKKLRLYKS